MHLFNASMGLLQVQHSIRKLSSVFRGLKRPWHAYRDGMDSGDLDMSCYGYALIPLILMQNGELFPCPLEMIFLLIIVLECVE